MSLFSSFKNQFHQQILDQAVDAVIAIDEHNCVQYYNRAAEQLWGFSAQEVILPSCLSKAIGKPQSTVKALKPPLKRHELAKVAVALP